MRATLLIALLGLAGCANWQTPGPQAAHYYCKPDSAVRYRSDTEPASKMVRKAPEHGSCRHQ